MNKNQQTITTFDKTTTGHVLSELEELLANFAADRGISVGRIRGSYSGEGLKVSVQLSTIQQNGVVNTPEAQAWKQLCALVYEDLTLAGFTADDLGAQFTAQGKTFTIQGYKMRARKRPVVATEVGTGHQYVFPVDAVARCMGKQAKNLDDQPFNQKR